MPDEDPHSLEYRTPDRDTDGCSPGCLLLPLALFALLCLCSGILNFAIGLRRYNHFFRSDEFESTTVMFLIGTVCGIATIRWYRDWRRR
jgi:hypothetical protein